MPARPARSASPVVRDALLTWLLTRVSVVILAVAGSWLLARGTAGLQPGFVELWDRWDVAVFVKIARFGYLGYPQDYPDTGTAAFFPGLPGALWMVRLITQDWVVAGLLVSLVAGGVAAVALARLAAADHGELVASRSVLYFAVSPFAVFLAAGYSEALFLAFALPAWLAARQRRWLLAGVLGGLAGTVRVTGFFLGSALLVQWLTSGGNERRWRDLPPLLLPWAAVAGYVVYLHAITGDWLGVAARPGPGVRPPARPPLAGAADDRARRAGPAPARPLRLVVRRRDRGDGRGGCPDRRPAPAPQLGRGGVRRRAARRSCHLVVLCVHRPGDAAVVALWVLLAVAAARGGGCTRPT